MSHTATPLPKDYDCVAVYIAGHRTHLVIYGWRPKPPTKKKFLSSLRPEGHVFNIVWAAMIKACYNMLPLRFDLSFQLKYKKW